MEEKTIFDIAREQGRKDYATGRMINYGQKNRGLGGATLSAWVNGYLAEHKTRFDESGIKAYKKIVGKGISENN